MSGSDGEGARRCGPRAGVYSLTCRGTGRTLLGCSDHLAEEIEEHRRRLAEGAHPNAALQADYDAHGAAAFDIAVHDELAPLDGAPDGETRRRLRELQDLWVDELGLDEGRTY